MKTDEKILNATIKEIANNGISGLKLKNIADECGIKTASIYAFFKSREDLVNKSIEYAESVFAKIKININLNGSISFIIYNLFLYYIDLFCDEFLNAYYRLLQKEALTNKTINSLYQSFTYTLETQIRFLLSEKISKKDENENDENNIDLLSLILKDCLLSILFTLSSDNKESAVWEAKRKSSLLENLF